MQRLFLTIAVLMALGSLPAAADVRLEATIDKKKMGLDETATLRVFVEMDQQTLPTPKLPALDAFDVYSSGRNQNFQMINGRVNMSIRYDYVLSPRSEGRHRIGPITVEIDGKTYETEPILLTVTKARQESPAPSPPAPDPRAAGQSNRRVFITASLDQDTAYVNEQVVYIFRFYRAERLLSSPEYTRPAFPGFWVEELPPQRKYNTVVDGVGYEVTEIRTGLFPTDAGVKNIDAARLKATVRSRQSDRVSPFGNDLFGFFGGGEDLRLKSSPVTLTVLPLPTTGKPDGWGGLVGKFEIEAHADVREVNVGDPITVAVTVSGVGNVKSIPPPTFDSLPDFRSFSAGSSEDVSKAGYQVAGGKTFDEVFVPQRPGSYILPAFSLTYFDPDARAYRTRYTDSIPVTVTGGAADFTIPSFRLNPEELSDLAADVRFLKTDGTGLRRAQGTGLLGWMFWGGHILPLMGLVALVGWRRRALREAADPSRRRRRRALRIALDHITGDRAISTHDVAQALLRFYSDRYNRSAHGQLRADILATLRQDGVDGPVAEEYLALLDECDRNRYTPGDSDGASPELVARTRDVLSRIERAK